MNQAQVFAFVEQYLQQTNCQVLERTKQQLITQLSIEADKAILQRPYYWDYVEQLQLVPEPLTLCLNFDLAACKPHPRWRTVQLFYGSALLQRIMQATIARGQFAHLYQSPSCLARMRSDTLRYQPWLGLNFKVSYVAGKKRERLWPAAINLQTGVQEPTLYTRAAQLHWLTTPPGPHSVQAATLTLPQAVQRLEEVLVAELQAEDDAWATAATQAMEADLAVLGEYYLDEAARSLPEYHLRRAEIEDKYRPQIQVELLSAGLFNLLDG